jgi:hypothetical protein
VADIIRLSIMGTMPSGEVWSTNPVYKIGGDFGVPVSAAQAATIATACLAVAVPTALRTMNVSTVNFSGIRVEARSKAGVLESQAEAVRGAPTTGSGTAPHGFSTALVSSLRTAHPGPSGRGRLYWPATSILLTTASLRVDPTNLISYRDSVKTYLSGLEAAIQATVTGVSLTVWSRKGLATYPVTSIQVGDIVDTQRRRRDAAIENYSAVAYP